MKRYQTPRIAYVYCVMICNNNNDNNTNNSNDNSNNTVINNNSDNHINIGMWRMALSNIVNHIRDTYISL